jgi:cytochrome c-type biogenesis protein CcmH
MMLRNTLAAIFLVGCLNLAWGAGLESFDFSGNVEEQRYKDLLAELRCLVCQNQSLVDSDAELAHDLRLEVYELMAQGRDDAQIRDFLVARYGDFVLYEPPIKPSTYLLWAGPFVLLALGLMMLFRTIRQRRQLQESEFSAEEQERLRQLLGTRPHEQEDRQ